MKIWKKTLLATTVLLTSIFVPIHNQAYAEQNSWAAPYIEKVIQQQIMSYDTNGQFQPYRIVTRGEAAQAIVNARRFTLETNVQLQAADLPVTHPHYEAIHQLVQLGVMQNSTAINPDAPVTRAQMAKMVTLAFDIKVDNRNVTRFTDLQRDYWGTPYIESLADVGVVGGDAQRFMPLAFVKKGQLAKFVIEAAAFKRQVDQLEIAYNPLAECYIMTTLDYPRWMREITQQVNTYRIQQDVAPLVVDPQLNQLAAIKAHDMVERGYFNHRSPYYGQAWDLASIYNYTFVAMGENIARNFTASDQAVKAWIASDTHRENLLNERYTHTGVAIAKDDDGRYYWIQLFSRK